MRLKATVLDRLPGKRPQQGAGRLIAFDGVLVAGLGTLPGLQPASVRWLALAAGICCLWLVSELRWRARIRVRLNGAGAGDQADEIAAVNRQLTHILDSTSEGIFKLNRNWTVVYANRRASAMSSDLVVGKDYWQCFPAARGGEVERCLRRTMDQREESEWEIYWEPYDEWFAVHSYATEAGTSVFFVPMTTRKRLEARLEDERAQREKRIEARLDEERTLREKRIEALSVLAGGLAHEISNPLAIIHGTATELIGVAAAGLPVSAGDVLRAGEDIARTADRASRILRGLRGFAREAGSDPMESASIYRIVDEAIEIQHARFLRHGVDLRLELTPGISPILCRETQVGQIVTNLINNAYDAITEHDCAERWVSVEAIQQADLLQIDVADSGPGIDEEMRKHLMEPFYTTKKRGLGMGVGLSLSRAMAIEHGGSLELCRGTEHTCFRLLLPLRPEDPAALLEPVGRTYEAI